jgi:hypothetical protein
MRPPANVAEAFAFARQIGLDRRGRWTAIRTCARRSRWRAAAARRGAPALDERDEVRGGSRPGGTPLAPSAVG